MSDDAKCKHDWAVYDSLAFRVVWKCHACGAVWIPPTNKTADEPDTPAPAPAAPTDAKCVHGWPTGTCGLPHAAPTEPDASLADDVRWFREVCREVTQVHDELCDFGKDVDNDGGECEECSCHVERVIQAASRLGDVVRERDREAAIDERVAQLRAHRACGGEEHDPANSRLHGCCVVCIVPWPCEIAKVRR